MGRADRASQLVATAGCILAAQPVWSFFVPSKVAFNSGGTSLLQQTQTTTCATHKGGVGVNLGYFCRRENYHAKAKARSRMTRGSVTMERPTGRFQTLAKPKFDPENPNAVLGEIQVCMAAHAQLFPKREAVQWMKERLQAWCLEENRREIEGELVALGPGLGVVDNSGRQRRSWNAYELTMLPSRNRTLDSNVVGMNVGLCVNDSRIDVMVDYGNQTEAPEVALRLQKMMAEVSGEANAVFGFPDDVLARGIEAKNLGPWKKMGIVNSWRKWLHLDSGKDFPESAVTIFRTVQANWAVPEKIAAAMNFTTHWCTACFEESMATPGTPLLRVDVFHSALHPHVIKVMETYVSSDDFLNQYHTHYNDYLDGVASFRAAVGPTVQCYTPLICSRRPCLSARQLGGAMIPTIAIGAPEAGVAPSPDVLLEGLKIGLRHVVLEAGSTGIGEVVAALEGAIFLGVVKREDLFITLMLGEDLPRAEGADGLAGAVRNTLASGNGGRGGRVRGSSLGYVDSLVLNRESGRFFDDDDAFVSLWNQAREAALYPSAVWDDSAPQANDQAVATAAAAGPSKSAHLARTLGIGGHGPLVYDRLSFLVEKAKATNPTLSENTPGPVPAPHSESGPVLHSEQGSRSGPVCGSGVAVAPPEIVPSVFWGDVGAGYRVASARTIDFCRDCGVQAFSLRYDGGEGGEAALKRAEGAADFEFENVSPDEFLAKWVLEVGGGIVWRPSEARSASKTLTMLRYFIPPEWITEIAYKAGCPPEDWARTRSRLLYPNALPTDEELRQEAEDLVLRMLSDEGTAEDDDGYHDDESI